MIDTKEHINTIDRLIKERLDSIIKYFSEIDTNKDLDSILINKKNQLEILIEIRQLIQQLDNAPEQPTKDTPSTKKESNPTIASLVACAIICICTFLGYYIGGHGEGNSSSTDTTNCPCTCCCASTPPQPQDNGPIGAIIGLTVGTTISIGARIKLT